MKHLTTYILAILLISTTQSLSAQEANPTESKMEFSIEIDPMTFAMNGYSAHLRVKPKNSDHLLIGIGIYAMDIPDFLVNLNSKNKDMGWKSRLNNGIGLFTEHYFKEVNKGLFVGVQASMQEYKIEKEGYTESSKFTNTLIMGYGGYSFMPFDFNLYFKAWGGIGYSNQISGSNEIETEVYDNAALTYFGTLHVGYTF